MTSLSNNSYSDAEALVLLKQLEHILELDPLIDEVGFIHPSQFTKLEEEMSDTLSLQDTECRSTNFWNKDHKLGISTQILIPLYNAAKNAFISGLKQYRTLDNLSGKSEDDSLESEVMIHSKALLLLNCDFGTAWNSRKLIVSNKPLLPRLMDELNVSALVLSYSPKSEQVWSHRRWVINIISRNHSTRQWIIEKESELVEKVAERSKMNYRAWSHRCWLVSYMTREQVKVNYGTISGLFAIFSRTHMVLDELKKSRDWSGLHIADNSCFHYRRRLIVRSFEDFCHMQESNFSGQGVETYQVLKEELDWNESLIKRYVGREALWLHRRFVSLYLIKHIATRLGCSCLSSPKTILEINVDRLMNHELCLVCSCSTFPDDDFEDFQAQAIHSAAYILWLTKQIPEYQAIDVKEKLQAAGLTRMLKEACPDRSSLWDCLVDVESG